MLSGREMEIRHQEGRRASKSLSRRVTQRLGQSRCSINVSEFTDCSLGHENEASEMKPLRQRDPLGRQLRRAVGGRAGGLGLSRTAPSLQNSPGLFIS